MPMLSLRLHSMCAFLTCSNVPITPRAGHKEALARCMRLAVAKASPSGKHKPTINFHLQKARRAARASPIPRAA